MELTEVDSASANRSEIFIVTGLVSLLFVSTAPALALVLAVTVEFELLPFDELPEPQDDKMVTAQITPTAVK
jgi:hypothetical protein